MSASPDPWWVIVLVYDDYELATYVDIVQAADEDSAVQRTLDEFYVRNDQFIDEDCSAQQDAAQRFCLDCTQVVCLNDWFVNLEYKP